MSNIKEWSTDVTELCKPEEQISEKHFFSHKCFLCEQKISLIDKNNLSINRQALDWNGSSLDLWSLRSTKSSAVSLSILTRKNPLPF